MNKADLMLLCSEFKHPVGTVMRMLKEDVPFTPRAQSDSAHEL